VADDARAKELVDKCPDVRSGSLSWSTRDALSDKSHVGTILRGMRWSSPLIGSGLVYVSPSAPCIWAHDTGKGNSMRIRRDMGID
jgi:hypothetical protein